MLINFLQKTKPRTVAIQTLQEPLKLLKNFLAAQQITKLFNNNSGQKTFSRSGENSCCGNSVNICEACAV